MSKNKVTSKNKGSKKSAPKSSPKKAKADSPSRRKRWLGYFIKLSIVLGILFGVYLMYLDAKVQSRFEGRRWQLPAKVYSRPLELYGGALVNREQLLSELQQLGYRKVDAGDLGVGQYRADYTAVAFRTRGFDFPDGATQPADVQVGFNDGLLDTVVINGNAEEALRLEPQLIAGIYPAHKEDRSLVSLDEVPAAFISALIAIEDRNFFSHYGVSLRGIARAFVANLKAGRVEQGGSTLTQQLVKNFYLSSERRFTRKINEALMALLLEFHYDKNTILQAYFNEVYLGQAGQKAIHGIGLGSLFYFGVPIRELQLHQIALMVGLVKGPSWYEPRRHPERATKRRNQVLKAMLNEQMITQLQYDAAVAAPLDVVAKPVYVDERYPAFMELVKAQLREEYRDEDLRSNGLQVFTSLDPYLQDQLQHQIRAHLGLVNEMQGPEYDDLQAAGVITDANNGELLALVGDRSLYSTGFNRALGAKRPIGSLVKPALYLKALSEGYTLATLIDDQPVTVSLGNGQRWEPENYGGEYHGAVPLQEALAKSYNLAAVGLVQKVGVDALVDTLQQLGVTSYIPPVPSLALGSLELSPYEVAQFYQTIAAGGFYTPIRTVRAVVDAEGNPLQRFNLEVEKRWDAESTYLLTTALQQVVESGTGRGVSRYLPADLSFAGKTGTSNSGRDSWFTGWDGSHLGVVWVGFDDNRPTKLTGSSGALPILAGSLAKVPQRPLLLAAPENVSWKWIDPIIGVVTDPSCEGAYYVPVIAGTGPQDFMPCQGGEVGPEKTTQTRTTRPAPRDKIIDWFKSWLE